MRVTEKGQVTIPLNVRRHLGIAPGSQVEFEFVEGGAILKKVDPQNADKDREARELIDHMRRHKGKMNLGGMSADDFYRMLRD